MKHLINTLVLTLFYLLIAWILSDGYIEPTPINTDRGWYEYEQEQIKQEGTTNETT